jgi:hypothetical protein
MRRTQGGQGCTKIVGSIAAVNGNDCLFVNKGTRIVPKNSIYEILLRIEQPWMQQHGQVVAV